MMSGWHLYYGRWWMIQWCFDWWFSLGIHVDFRTRVRSTDLKKYGPYIDFHLGFIIISIGRNPVYSGELDLIAPGGRGGLS